MSRPGVSERCKSPGIIVLGLSVGRIYNTQASVGLDLCSIMCIPEKLLLNYIFVIQMTFSMKVGISL